MPAYKICPICGTRAHRAAYVCQTCGASLDDVTPSSQEPGLLETSVSPGFGEDDLLERRLEVRGRRVFAVMISLVVTATLTVATFVLLMQTVLRPAPEGTQPLPTPSLVLETNVPEPNPALNTVTPMPPTATRTATPSPCIRVVQAGDTLVSIISACGYNSLDILPEVLSLNGLLSAEVIQQGQEIIVPLPTSVDAANAGPVSIASVPDTALQPPIAAQEVTAAPTSQPLATATSTLLAGIGIHIVQPDESMVSIAYQYRTNAETLSQLNPEISFSQCDFSLDTGGPRCTVLIGIGQPFRVPVPTPTATLTPTLSGSETPTPAPTATFNAPNPIAPENRVLFLSNQLITLRWIGTGALAEDEVYLVMVDDLTLGAAFRAETRDLSFVIPDDWQPIGIEPSDFQWSIAVIRTNDPASPLYITTPRLFTWQGRAETSETP